MKGILGLLRRAAPGTRAQEGASDSSAFFSSAFAQHDAGNAPLVPWEARAVEIGAEALSPRRGSALLQQLWSKDKYMAQLGEAGLCRLEPFFAFARLGSNRDLIRQNEYGNFMVVLLSGAVSIDRLQTWGEVLRLAGMRLAPTSTARASQGTSMVDSTPWLANAVEKKTES